MKLFEAGAIQQFQHLILLNHFCSRFLNVSTLDKTLASISHFQCFVHKEMECIWFKIYSPKKKNQGYAEEKLSVLHNDYELHLTALEYLSVNHSAYSFLQLL